MGIVKLENGLEWNSEEDEGILNTFDPGVYDDKYFENYQFLETTEMGEKITKLRIAFVDGFAHGQEVLDIGVGSGQFVHNRPNTLGYDINPLAVDMLSKECLFLDPYGLEDRSVYAMSFWDSLEHFTPEDLPRILSKVGRYVFISCPVYESLEAVLKSKHFKPGEHIFYWTYSGIEKRMAKHGFRRVAFNAMEVWAGREGIMTYCFERID